MRGWSRFHQPHMIALYAVLGFGGSLLIDHGRMVLMEHSEKYKDELVIRHRKRLGQSLDLLE